jgi:hypothetical protein
MRSLAPVWMWMWSAEGVLPVFCWRVRYCHWHAAQQMSDMRAINARQEDEGREAGWSRENSAAAMRQALLFTRPAQTLSAHALVRCCGLHRPFAVVP